MIPACTCTRPTSLRWCVCHRQQRAKHRRSRFYDRIPAADAGRRRRKLVGLVSYSWRSRTPSGGRTDARVSPSVHLLCFTAVIEQLAHAVGEYIFTMFDPCFAERTCYHPVLLLPLYDSQSHLGRVRRSCTTNIQQTRQTHACCLPVTGDTAPRSQRRPVIKVYWL